MDHAISRARARRRQIKPPHPLWLLALLFVVLAFVVMVWDFFDLPNVGAYLSIVGMVMFIYAWWPTVSGDRHHPLPLSPTQHKLSLVAIPFAVLGMILS
jgi:hypothetical protein